MSAIKVAIVDDDEGIRTSLASLIRRNSALKFSGDYPDAETALREIPRNPPNVVLMDINMPGMKGVECVRQLKAALPDVQFLMLTVYEDSDSLFNSLKAGASGYLLKTIEGDALAAAIRRAMRGESTVAEEMTGKLVAAYRDAAAPQAAQDAEPAAPASLLHTLSPREQDILLGIAQGQGNKEIARSLGIAETTVKIHVQHILRKLGVSSRVQAAVIAVEHGLG